MRFFALYNFCDYNDFEYFRASENKFLMGSNCIYYGTKCKAQKLEKLLTYTLRILVQFFKSITHIKDFTQGGTFQAKYIESIKNFLKMDFLPNDISFAYEWGNTKVKKYLPMPNSARFCWKEKSFSRIL